ncbi:RcpC/CpaB family pilus assembly protein [Streptomyces venezuelae]|uniref:RcpC/CpaB family pilus assembly protein n=1 Tax=Streptomyces venezuelae TaxID=54571 RepID=UPI0036562B74
MTAPVRIADADTVRLLRPGDRVDVIAADGSPSAGAEPQVVASGARVTAVPEPGETPVESGALVVLSVPRDAAARLAGAGASARLAVTLR